jgi:hypothetical protein
MVETPQGGVVDLISVFLDLLLEIFILIMLNQSRSNPNLEDSRHPEDKYDRLVDSFVEDVMRLSLVVLLVRWGQNGIRPVSAVRFVMSCWNM